MDWGQAEIGPTELKTRVASGYLQLFVKIWLDMAFKIFNIVWCVFLWCQIVIEWAIDGNYILIKALQDKSKLGQPSKWPKMLWCLIAEFDSHQIIFSFFSSCESNLGQCASPCQVRKTPAPALPLRVDVSHYELPLPAHDQLRVVLEVVHLRGKRGLNRKSHEGGEWLTS